MATSGQPEKHTPPRSAVILLLADIGQTTWQMFVPTLGGFGLGMWADGAWHTAPWMMCSGLFIGIVIAALLTLRQFRKIKEKK